MDKIINHLLQAQQSLAQAVATGALPEPDKKQLRFMLHVLPEVIKRAEEAEVGRVNVHELLPQERKCCGTFVGSAHRSTCFGVGE